MLKLVVLAVLVFQANCFIQSYDYNDAIKKTEDMVIRPFLPEGYGHIFQRTARLNNLLGPGRFRFSQTADSQEPSVRLPSSLPNIDEMVIKSLMTDMFGDREAEILFNHKPESPKHQSTQKANKPSSSWMIEIAEEENSDMQVQDDKKLKQILEILGLESTDDLTAKPVVKPTWKNQNGEFFSQEFKQYLQAPLPQAPVQPNPLTQQQPINWQMNQPSETVLPKPIDESVLDELKEKIVDSEKSFLDQLIRPQEEKPEEKTVEKSSEYESGEENGEWNGDNQEDEEEDGVEKLVAKQDEVLNAFAAQQTSHAPHIDSSYVFVELGQKIELEKAEQLLHYISDFSQVPYESFKDLRLKDSLMVFKVDDKANVNAWSVSNSILTHKLKIWHALGQTVLSSGVGKDLKQTNESSNTVMIVAIVLSISLSLCLAALIICCMVRRKSQSLRDQLLAAGDVGLMKAAANMKRGRDDEESLIRDNTTPSNWLSYLPFIKRAQKDQARSGAEHLSNQQDYQDLCRQRMQSNMISTSIQNEVGTKVSVTPVRVNSQDDDN